MTPFDTQGAILQRQHQQILSGVRMLSLLRIGQHEHFVESVVEECLAGLQLLLGNIGVAARRLTKIDGVLTGFPTGDFRLRVTGSA